MSALRWTLAVIASLVAVQPFEEDPSLFLLNDELGSTLTSPRQRLPAGTAAARPKVVGWSNDAAATAVQQKSPNGVSVMIDDPDLLGTLYGGTQRLGESASKQGGQQPGQASATSKQAQATSFKTSVARILGTFVIEAEAREEDEDSHLRLGEAAAKQAVAAAALRKNVTAEGGADIEIEAAKRVLSGQKLEPAVRQIATKYLAEKQRQHHALEAMTVKKLSKELFEAKLKSAEMEKLGEMAAAQFNAPVIGKKYKLGLGRSGHRKVMTLTVDGTKFHSGAEYTSPEGHIVSQERCERYLKKHNVVANVRTAKAALARAAINYKTLHTQARELSGKAIAQKEAAKLAATPMKNQLGSSKEADTKLVEADTAMGKAAAAVRAAKAAKLAMVKSKVTLKKAEAKEVKSKAKMGQEDNLDARETEISQREKAMAEREYVYKQAAEKLEEAAVNMKNAAENQVVEAFPVQERRLKAAQKAVKQQQEALEKKQLEIHHKAELLSSRMGAFNAAVKTIIENAAKSSSGIADQWSKDSEDQINHEVDGFQAALKAIKDKFGSKNKLEANAARDGAKIVTAVHNAVEQAQARLRSVHLLKQVNHKKQLLANNIQTDLAKRTSQAIANHTAPKVGVIRN